VVVITFELSELFVVDVEGFEVVLLVLCEVVLLVLCGVVLIVLCGVVLLVLGGVVLLVPWGVVLLVLCEVVLLVLCEDVELVVVKRFSNSTRFRLSGAASGCGTKAEADKAARESTANIRIDFMIIEIQSNCSI
jgi:hypothetical protein